MRSALLSSTRIAALASFVVALHAPAQSAHPRDGSSVLAGRIRDVYGASLAGATVTASGEKPAITTDSGEFRITRATSGITTVVVIRLGYAPLSFTIRLPQDSTVVVEIHMTPVAASLPTVLATAERSDPLLTTTGFFERQRHEAFGNFMTPAEIARLPFQHPAQFLLEVPGMEIRKRPNDPGYDVHGPEACYAVFVDGTFTRLPLEDAVNTSQVYAIEAYPRAAFVPAQFQAPMREQVCGAIVIWTTKYRSR